MTTTYTILAIKIKEYTKDSLSFLTKEHVQRGGNPKIMEFYSYCNERIGRLAIGPAFLDSPNYGRVFFNCTGFDKIDETRYVL